MPHNNEKQAMVPKRGKKIPNSCGTAPGVLFEDGGCTAILMPGVPHEMREMFERSVRGHPDADGGRRNRLDHAACLRPG